MQQGYATDPNVNAANDAVTPDNAAPAAAAAAAPANQRAANNRGGDGAIRMNAQGGPVMDDDEEEGGDRDWLDWIYTLSRFSVLVSIVYFYSTFNRFLLVFSLFLIVYM